MLSGRSIIIISGGQTGVDRAALDFALNNKIPCGGWCPKGRKADDGPLSQKYPLSETSSQQYPARTKLNIETSDATLILFQDRFDKGTGLTLQLCKKLNKPFWVHNLSEPLNRETFRSWLEKKNIGTLNVAGPRERFSPGIYEKTLDFLNDNLS